MVEFRAHDRDSSETLNRGKWTRYTAWCMRRRCMFMLIVLLVSSSAALGTSGRGEEAPDGAAAGEDASAELSEKTNELRAIEEKIRALHERRAAKEQEEESITNAIELMESQIEEARLQLDLTAVTIKEMRLLIKENSEELEALTKRMGRLRTDILHLLRAMDAFDRRSALEMLVLQGTFADFLQAREAYQSVQNRATALLYETADAKHAREKKEIELAERQEDLLNLQKLQEAQAQSLKQEEERKRTLLSRTVAEQARVSSLIGEAEQARREIQQEIFSLRNVGLQLSLAEAIELAKYAGSLTGVRPALLLGVLKVESNIGTNVGSGRYPDDMHPAHREAFLHVTEKLGLDPSTTPVSAKPTSYAGWGGALGPGQIMPGTWERVESVVAKLTGNPVPSPFDLRDAFVATAVILQGAGAADGREFEAVNRYFAGPNWQRFTWYGDRVLAVSKEYEARGL